MPAEPGQLERLLHVQHRRRPAGARLDSWSAHAPGRGERARWIFVTNTAQYFVRQPAPASRAPAQGSLATRQRTASVSAVTKVVVVVAGARSRSLGGEGVNSHPLSPVPARSPPGTLRPRPAQGVSLGPSRR